MGDAGDILAGPIAVVGALARGEKRLPRNARGIVDPSLFRLGITARRLALLDDLAASTYADRA